VLGVLTLSAAIAAGAYLLTRPDADAPSAARQTPPAVQAPPPAPPPQPAGPPTPRRVYSQAKAFVDSGVRFRIVAHPDAPWARRIRRTDAADGRRWQFVYVLYRNLARDRLVAEDLQFRLKDGLDNVYDPLPGAGNGGSDLPPGTQIAPGRLVKGQLAFQVPRDGRSLSLIIDLKPETRARVPLGSG
jgi:hypothetical protein